MTVLVAILLALGVPFAQLHTEKVRITCCCPDPDHCKCPDHKPDKSGQPRMSVCHKKMPELVRTQAPAFVSPELVAVATPVVVALEIVHVLAVPHAPPPPRRPDAPS